MELSSARHSVSDFYLFRGTIYRTSLANRKSFKLQYHIYLLRHWSADEPSQLSRVLPSRTTRSYEPSRPVQPRFGHRALRHLFLSSWFLLSRPTAGTRSCAMVNKYLKKKKKMCVHILLVYTRDSSSRQDVSRWWSPLRNVCASPCL